MVISADIFAVLLRYFQCSIGNLTIIKIISCSFTKAGGVLAEELAIFKMKLSYMKGLFYEHN